MEPRAHWLDAMCPRLLSTGVTSSYSCTSPLYRALGTTQALTLTQQARCWQLSPCDSPYTIFNFSRLKEMCNHVYQASFLCVSHRRGLLNGTVSVALSSLHDSLLLLFIWGGAKFHGWWLKLRPHTNWANAQPLSYIPSPFKLKANSQVDLNLTLYLRQPLSSQSSWLVFWEPGLEDWATMSSSKVVLENGFEPKEETQSRGQWSWGDSRVTPYTASLLKLTCFCKTKWSSDTQWRSPIPAVASFECAGSFGSSPWEQVELEEDNFPSFKFLPYPWAPDIKCLVLFFETVLLWSPDCPQSVLQTSCLSFLSARILRFWQHTRH